MNIFKNSLESEDTSVDQFFHQPKSCISKEVAPTVNLNNSSLTYVCKADNNILQTSSSKSIGMNEEKVLLFPLTLSSSHSSVQLKEIKNRVVQVFNCNEKNCGKAYSTAHHLKVHKRTHTGEKPFQCKWKNCNKMFTTCYALKAHGRVHTGEKPFPCPQTDCKKAFKTSSDLQKHIRTHTGEKPFKCPFPGCSKAFTTSDICKVHIRTHTGERPHKCPFADCGKSFSNYTNYKNHIRTHTGERPYVCMVKGCGKRFTEYSSLYKHQIVHSVQKPYTCSLCNKSYRQVSTLVYHKKRVHNDYKNAAKLYTSKKSLLENSVSSPSIIANSSLQEISNKDPYDSTLVVLPIDSISSDCYVVDNSSEPQLSLLSPTENQDKFEVVTSPVNNDSLVVTLSDSSSSVFNSHSDVAAHISDTTTPLVLSSDDSMMYINTQTLSPSVTTPSTPVLSGLDEITSPSDSHMLSKNPESIWLNLSSPTTADSPQKQADIQLPVETFEIDGTKYVKWFLQVLPLQVGLDPEPETNPSNDPSNSLKDNRKDETKYFTSTSNATSIFPHTPIPNPSVLTQSSTTFERYISKPKALTTQTDPLKSTSPAKPISFPAAKQRITVKLPRKLSALSKSLSTKPETKKRVLLPKL